MTDHDRNSSGTSYYIKRLSITNLWGTRNPSIQFDKRVNIIIGPNASGKTTILNILRYVFTLDLSGLYETTFDEVEIGLRSFNERSRRTVRVKSTQAGLSFTVSGHVLDLDLEAMAHRYHPALRKRLLDDKKSQLVRLLGELVPAVWLPVSRRLPMPEEEEREHRVNRPITMESVDVRLRDLLEQLSRYRLRLEAQLAERYKAFEKQVMQVILYSKEFDAFDPGTLQYDIQADKAPLIAAYQAAGLLDGDVLQRIETHFRSATRARKRLVTSLSQDPPQINARDAFVFPLIRRTRSMIEYSRKLEDDRDKIFAPLRHYEETVTSFLTTKKVRVDDYGNLSINDLRSGKTLQPFLLSSGEKQLLILLTQALLWEDRPVVYVVDEPELSLHVTWQSRLLKALSELAQTIQIIVATHSPDIVGEYRSNVISLAE